MRSTSAELFSKGPAHDIQRRKGPWWRWLSIRRIHVESIVLCGNEVRPGFMIPSMRRVHAKNFSSNADLQYLVRNCPSLQCLSIETMHHDARIMGAPVEIDLEVLSDLRLSLEEFSYDRSTFFELYEDDDQEYYQRTASALVNMLRECTRLRKVSLLRDSLHSVDLEELHPYGNLFHELSFEYEGRTNGYGQAIANLFVFCSTLRKVHYQGSDGVQDSLVVTAIHQCPMLEELHLSFLQKQVLDVDGFINVSRNCRNVHTLEMFGCCLSTAALRNIAVMHALKELTLTNCEELIDTDLAELAVAKLSKLVIANIANYSFELTASSLAVLVGSGLSQTLVSFELSAFGTRVPVDDAQVAFTLASCHKLKTLKVVSRRGGCLFGRNGLEGLQAMAAGCPLLENVSFELTASGMHYVGTHFTSVKKCSIVKYDSVRKDRPSPTELRTLYPAIKWTF